MNKKNNVVLNTLEEKTDFINQHICDGYVECFADTVINSYKKGRGRYGGIYLYETASSPKEYRKLYKLMDKICDRKEDTLMLYMRNKNRKKIGIGIAIGVGAVYGGKKLVETIKERVNKKN